MGKFLRYRPDRLPGIKVGDTAPLAFGPEIIISLKVSVFCVQDQGVKCRSGNSGAAGPEPLAQQAAG